MADHIEFLSLVADQVFDRFSAVGFYQMTEPEKVFFLVWSAHGEIDNGGLDQFYFNSSGDFSAHTPAALRVIGAGALADILSRANKLFPVGPPENDAIRQTQLNSLTEEQQALFGKARRPVFKRSRGDRCSAIFICRVQLEDR